MKKIVPLFLCLMLLCPALALADGKTVTLEEMGIEYQMDLGPVTKYGSAHVAQDGILSHSPYIACLEYSYAMIPPAEMERLSRAGKPDGRGAAPSEHPDRALRFRFRLGRHGRAGG